MSWLTGIWRSALGKKAVMALTGVFLFGWIFAHMVGNLKLFLPDYVDEHGATVVPLNHYAEWLRTIGTPMLPNQVALWIVRVLLLVAVWLHIQAATELTIMNKKARPVDYTDRAYPAATYAARTMRWGGVIILLFIIYHLLHLTFGTVHPDFIGATADHPADVYHNVVAGLAVWWTAASYIIANCALGLHLYHGLWSMFNSLGLNSARLNPWKRSFATLFALVITVGNVSMPLMVMLGYGKR